MSNENIPTTEQSMAMVAAVAAENLKHRLRKFSKSTEDFTSIEVDLDRGVVTMSYQDIIAFNKAMDEREKAETQALTDLATALDRTKRAFESLDGAYLPFHKER